MSLNPTPQPDPQALTQVPLAPVNRGMPATIAGTPAQLQFSGAPDALSLLKALRRRWVLALGLGIVCAAVVGYATWLVAPPSKYTVRAMFRVSSDAPRVIFATSEGRIDLDTYQKTQVTMIRSRGILEKALSQPEVEKLALVRNRTGDRVEWLEKELRLDYSGEVLRLAISGQSPDDLTTLLNAVADVYQEEVVDKERDLRLKRYDELKKIYDDYQKRLEDKRKSLRAAAELMGSNDKSVLALKHQLVLERLSLAQKELMEIQSELRRAQAELAGQPSRAAPRQVDPKNTSGAAESAFQQYLSLDQELSRLQARTGSLEATIFSSRRRVRNLADPYLLKLQRDLIDARKAEARRTATLRSAFEGQWREKAPAWQDLAGRGVLDGQILEARVQMLRELERVTNQVVHTLTEETQSFNRDSMGLESLQDEIAHADSASKKIGAEVEVLGVELKAPSRVVPIERASTPRQEDEQRQVKLTAITSLGAILLVFAGVSLREFYARRVSTTDDVFHGLGMRIVGTIPSIPRRTSAMLEDPPKRREQVWRRLLVESVKAARTMVIHASQAENRRIVMITSALEGEGKTSLACHLAMSVALTGRRTLLVDCDLRRPTAHRLFNLDYTPGFCEYLRGEFALTDVVRPTAIPKLSLLAAGRADPISLQALAFPETEAAFDWMRDQFDFVVIDTSPVLPVADSLTICSHVDTVIFSILRDVSRIVKVNTAYLRISELGVPVLGAVVSGTPNDTYNSYYSHQGPKSGFRA